MSFQKNITVLYGQAQVPVVANFHTVTFLGGDFTLLPQMGLSDPNDPNSICEIKAGAKPFIRLSSFVDRATYDANDGCIKFALRTKEYEIPMMVMFQALQTCQLISPQQQCYDYIRSIDPEFSDAQDVP